MCVVGWGVGQFVSLPRDQLAVLVALISGAIIMNDSFMELEQESHRRFTAFGAGGLIYGLILLPLG